MSTYNSNADEKIKKAIKFQITSNRQKYSKNLEFTRIYQVIIRHAKLLHFYY